MSGSRLPHLCRLAAALLWAAVPLPASARDTPVRNAQAAPPATPFISKPGLDLAAPALEHGPSVVYSNTSHVEAVAASREQLWVATRGGLEEYELATGQRVRHYTTRDGLPRMHIDGVTASPDGEVTVTTPEHECLMRPQARRFRCRGRKAPPKAYVQSSELIEGAAVTSRHVGSDGVEWLGTAGQGLWARQSGISRRLTAAAQLSGNHVVSIASYAGAIWLATFDRGLSRFKDGTFQDAALGQRMLNDLAATDVALYVATSKGLYASHDGERFERDPRVFEQTISDLAYDATNGTLYVAATNSLWELSTTAPHKPPRVSYQPGGTRSLQAVDVSSDGLVFLATEDRGVLLRETRGRFTAFDRLAGYPSSWVLDVLALGGRSALAGSLRHGVFPIATRAPETVQLDPWVLFLGRNAQRPSTLFVGTQGGAAIIRDDKLQPLRGLPDPCVHTMAQLGDELWVGTEGGLAVYR